MTYAEEIEKIAGAQITFIAVGDYYNRPWYSNGVTVTWEEARPHLNYEYAAGYGGEDCHPICAWTESEVIFSVCYDGSTWLAKVSRNPVDCIPEFHGGG